jgi:hypothetical protein
LALFLYTVAKTCGYFLQWKLPVNGFFEIDNWINLHISVVHIGTVNYRQLLVWYISENPLALVMVRPERYSYC